MGDGYVPSLNLQYTAWLKPHSGNGTLYNYSPVVQANQAQHSYNKLYMWNTEGVCWESTHGNAYACLEVAWDLYEWHQYTFISEVMDGQAGYEAFKDTSNQDSSYENLAIMRIYDEVDFTLVQPPNTTQLDLMVTRS